MKRTNFTIGVLLVVAALVASLVMYPQLPDRIPTHWNIHGQVDAYGTKAVVFIAPGVMAGMLVLFWLLPWLLPRHFEVDTFVSTYLFIMFAMLGILGYIHALLLWAGAVGPVNFSRALAGGIFVFFVLLGNVLGKVRRNFYIGVRTPWTLANERVWNDTHRVAARVFVLAGLVGLVGTMARLPLVALFIFLVASVFVPVVFSVVEYKRLERRGEV